jgi:hypothetical protein
MRLNLRGRSLRVFLYAWMRDNFNGLVFDNVRKAQKMVFKGSEFQILLPRP